LAYDWDNVGLQIGDLNRDINHVLITLDVTKDVVQEAIEQNCELIIAHHPLLFRPLKQILPTQPVGQIIEMLIKHDIALYVAHTNYDVHPSGMNVALANQLKLSDHAILEMVDETHGLGIVGSLKDPMPMNQFASFVLKQFDLDDLKLIGDEQKVIKRVAIVGGSGSSVIMTALEQNVDVLITGDVTYHHALDAKAMGLTLLNVNHNIERFGLKQLKKVLEKEIQTCEFQVSKINTNPYLTIKKEA
jgi:dinuclear metal center YbgI/SA1388 family protein